MKYLLLSLCLVPILSFASFNVGDLVEVTCIYGVIPNSHPYLIGKIIEVSPDKEQYYIKTDKGESLVSTALCLISKK